MARRPISIKRRRRRSIILTLMSIAGIAVICAVWRAAGPSGEAEAAEATEKPLSEETTIHPPDYGKNDLPIVFKTPKPDIFQAEFTEDEITMAAQALWGEAHGVESRMEQAAVVWCFLNRVDRWGESLGDIVTSPHQFAYSAAYITVDDQGRDLKDVVYDVVERWEREKNGKSDVGRVLPSQYLYFGGDGEHNYFRTDYNRFDDVWEWTLPSPYKEDK